MKTFYRSVSFIHRLYIRLAHLARQPIAVPVYLLVITLVGISLRVYKLGDWSFWEDEMYSVGSQEDGFNYNLLRQSLSLALIQKNIAINGLNEQNARLVPAIIGMITLPVLFFGAKKLFETPTALLATLLLALSPWHIYWSQNARFYTALLLFYSLALFFFYWGIEQDKPWYLAGCLIFLGLAVKERLLALFFLPVVLIYLILLHIFSFEKPKGWRYRNLAIFALPGLLGGLIFAGPYLLNLPAWLGGFGFANNSPFWLAGGFAYYVGLPVVCLGSVGGYYLIMQKNRAGLLLSISAVVPLLLLLSISPFHYTANRYAFISLTSWLVLAALATTTLLIKTIWPFKLFTLGTLLILLISPLSENALYYLNQNGNRDNWKAAFAYVQENRQPNDLIVSGNPHIATYYLSTQTIGFGHLHLDDELAKDQSIWFVEDMASVQKYPDLHKWLIQHTQLVSVEDVNFQARNFSMRVYLYESEVNP